MYTKSAKYYDAIYALKDYDAETEALLSLISSRRTRPYRSLLDVGCGTGAHLARLRHHFHVEGLDLEPQLLAVAEERLPGVPLHRGDMLGFELSRTFDVVTSLFGVIGYARSPGGLYRAVGEMARHVAPGGLLIVEPWLTPEAYQSGTLHASFVDQPDLKLARMNLSLKQGDVSVLDLHYLVATPAGVESFSERHELGLFDLQTYQDAFEAAGLDVEIDPDGVDGRGLVLGYKSQPGDPSPS